MSEKRAASRERVVQVSTVIGAAVKEQREEAGWTEGVAIWVAVIVVSFVGRAFLTVAAPSSVKIGQAYLAYDVRSLSQFLGHHTKHVRSMHTHRQKAFQCL